MTRGKDYYKAAIHESAFARFYAATNSAMIDYPYLVGRYDESSPTLVEKCDEYILDSAIGDPTVGNEEVLERADDIGASVVVAADVLGEPHTTTDRIAEMLKLAEARDREYEVLVPLQFDAERDFSHVDHYNEVAGRLAELGYDVDSFRLYVGGVNQKSASEQIRRCIELREHVGTDVYLHGLGLGATREWVVTIRRCPWLLDSFDNSSVVKNLIYSGKLWTPEGDWVAMEMPRGSNSTVLAVEHIETSLHLYNYMISSDIDERDAIETFADPESELAERVDDHVQWHERHEADPFPELSESAP